MEDIQQERKPGGGPMEAAVRKARATQEAARQRIAAEKAAREGRQREINTAVDTLVKSKETMQTLHKGGAKPSGETPRDYLHSLSDPDIVTKAVEGLKKK